mgnify:CR=1 FL=1|jgi:hypothetical protein
MGIDNNIASIPTTTRETRTRIEQTKCPDCLAVGLGVFLSPLYTGKAGKVLIAGKCYRCRRQFTETDLFPTNS